MHFCTRRKCRVEVLRKKLRSSAPTSELLIDSENVLDRDFYSRRESIGDFFLDLHVGVTLFGWV